MEFSDDSEETFAKALAVLKVRSSSLIIIYCFLCYLSSFLSKWRCLDLCFERVQIIYEFFGWKLHLYMYVYKLYS